MTAASRRPERWFDESMVSDAVASLDADIARLDANVRESNPPPPKPDDTKGLVWGVVGIVMFLMLALVVILFLSGKRNPQQEIKPRTLITMAALFIGLPIGTYVWSRYFYGIRSKHVKQRDEALRQLTAQTPTLKFGHFEKITGESVGTVPWLASELDRVVECDLYGEYRGHKLTMLECTYVVDMTLSALETTVGKVGAMVMSHMQHEHIHRRSLEAVVFFDPVTPLPDALGAAIKQPLNWYFKRYLAKNGADAESLVSGPRWLVSSDPRQCQPTVQAATTPFLQDRPEAIVQVLGGYVIVIPQTWNWNRPTEMPIEAAAIERNLSWACDLYEALLKSAGITPPTDAGPSPTALIDTPTVPFPRTSTAAIPSAPAAPSAAPQPAHAATAPAAQVAPPKPPRGNIPLRIASGVCGLLMFGIGGILLIGVIAHSMMGQRAIQWPTVEGRVATSKVDVEAGASPRYSAHIEYDFEVRGKKYHGTRLALGIIEKDGDRAAIEAVVAKYKELEPVKVYYNPRDPKEAVLEPRLAGAEIGICVGIFSAAMSLLGVFLMYLGIRRPRVKAGAKVAPAV